MSFDLRQWNDNSNAANRLEENVDACVSFRRSLIIWVWWRPELFLLFCLMIDWLCWVIVIAFRTAHHFRIGENQRPLPLMMGVRVRWRLVDDLLLRWIRFPSRDWLTSVWSESQRAFSMGKCICANDYWTAYDLRSVLIRYESLTISFSSMKFHRWQRQSSSIRFFLFQHDLSYVCVHFIFSMTRARERERNKTSQSNIGIVNGFLVFLTYMCVGIKLKISKRSGERVEQAKRTQSIKLKSNSNKTLDTHCSSR